MPSSPRAVQAGSRLVLQRGASSDRGPRSSPFDDGSLGDTVGDVFILRKPERDPAPLPAFEIGAPRRTGSVVANLLASVVVNRAT